MVYITGDTHGDMTRLVTAAAGMTAQDSLIVAGDFGADEKGLNLLASLPVTFLFVDGNHEHFDLLASAPEERWHGGCTHLLRPNVRHLMRGQLFELEGRHLFTLGGAASPDAALRRARGASWFPDEIPSAAELAQARATLAAYTGDELTIITHAAPPQIMQYMQLYPDPREASLMQTLDMMASRPFDQWFFGHLHVDRRIARYVGCFETIHRIGD